MSESKNITCSELTWKVGKKNEPLVRSIAIHSDYKNFARRWISKFNNTCKAKVAEKMIYLWVTINAWASIVVPDKTRNHEDAYLIHAMAADRDFVKRFERLMAEQADFFTIVNDLIAKAPVFQVLWLRNNNVEAWDPEISRKEYVQQVIAKDPFTVIKKKDGTICDKVKHYRPECADKHFNADEPIPVDWPHTLHMIYQIRCNLFHGGKNYSSNRDRHFIKLAYSILWEMFKPELRNLGLMETDIDSEVPWNKLFIGSGFYFEKFNKGYDFSCENPHNIKYLIEILNRLGVADQFSNTDNTFLPKMETFNQESWISAIEDLHTGAEGGPSGMEQIELKIMDTYMAGLVRWLNYTGLNTTYSCDGHDRRAPVMTFVQTGGPKMFRSMLNILNANMAITGRGSDPNKIAICGRRNNHNNNSDFGRSDLLKLAEVLHRKKDDFRVLVSMAGRINIQRGN